MKTLFALTAASLVITASPALARHRTAMVCTKWHHGHCVKAKAVKARHVSRYKVGYVFGPSYDYTAYSALPQPYVTRYHLSPDGRYVYNNGYIYVVDPKTYAVERVIYALTH